MRRMQNSYNAQNAELQMIYKIWLSLSFDL